MTVAPPVAEIPQKQQQQIRLRGVRVNNLKGINLDLPTRQLIVLCGVSGSGKSSLAFDTLYAEGQRRYIESFSPYTRQFLPRLERPAADKIEGIRPALAIAQHGRTLSNRSTVSSATESQDYLRLLLAKIGRPWCEKCERDVQRYTVAAVSNWLTSCPAGTRFLLGFSATPAEGETWEEFVTRWQRDGFQRGIFAGLTKPLADLVRLPRPAIPQLSVIVDRLSIGTAELGRIGEALEMAFKRGDGTAVLWLEGSPTVAVTSPEPAEAVELDGKPWQQVALSNHYRCGSCGARFEEPSTSLFSANHPLGACPTCEGFGNLIDLDWDLIIPDPNLTLATGAIAPWNSDSYQLEFGALQQAAAAAGVSVTTPFQELSTEHQKWVKDGDGAEWTGVRGFFDRLERKKYLVHVRVYLNRWKSSRECPACHGQRLRPAALAFRVGGRNLAEFEHLSVSAALQAIQTLTLPPHEQRIAKQLLEQVSARLTYLEQVGLEYLTLDRPMRTLSGGESQRVALTKALGSSLVDTLYVLDEPSIGLHPRDSERLLTATRRLCARGNTVVVVEHEEAFLRQADQVVEIGPGAGERGGQVVFQGTPQELAVSHTATGDFLAGRRGAPRRERRPAAGYLRVQNARGHNLQGISVEIPLGVLCVVTGVSGAGKSTLVNETLFPAVGRRLQHDAEKPLPHDDVLGVGQITDCLLVDQSPIGRSPRSNPVTFVKAFDEIRQIFAETSDAKIRNFGVGHFSFNSELGRCGTCEGDGCLQVDMQFLPDVYITCPACHGTRYRSEILTVRHRDRSISDVLHMTVREAFQFFHGHRKVQQRLKPLLDVGLDYLRLGQPANTLSGGEAQRLKLAGYLSSAKRTRSLIILDEPTTGLHFADVSQLLDCFAALLSVGHSLLVIEHHLQILASADYLIDLGPGAAAAGGQVVAVGTPEEVCRVPESVTGQCLAEYFERMNVFFPPAERAKSTQ